MTSKERVKKCLRFQVPDRIGIYDVLSQSTREAWVVQGLAGENDPVDYFDHDIRVIDFLNPPKKEYDRSRFLCIGIDDPFQSRVKEIGLSETLKLLAYDRRNFRKRAQLYTDKLITQFFSFIKNNDFYDSVWLFGDYAHRRGLFFSPEIYKKDLLPLHRELCAVFLKEGLDVIVHSDGDIRELIPSFIDIGVKAIEPLETESGIDIFELRREYAKEIALFGNISYTSLKTSCRDFEEEVERKFSFLKEQGGYLYRLDKEVVHDVSLEEYRFAIEIIKKYGVC